MPTIRLMAYREQDGTVPMRDWLDGLPKKARNKCLVRLERLAALGHELRRPEADSLRDGIHELRTQYQRVNYRMLYFFRGQEIAVISHGLTKQQARVPALEIELALRRMRNFERDEGLHGFTWSDD